MDPQTAMILARTLQAQTGQPPSPEMLAGFYQSNDSTTGLDDALSSARAYLANAGQVGPTPAPSVPAPDGMTTPGMNPGGSGASGPGAGPTFGAPASIGQISNQANQGAIGAAGAKGQVGSMLSSIGSPLGGPLTSAMMAALNQLSKAVGFESVPGQNFNYFDMNTMLNDPEMANAITQQVDFAAPSSVAAQSISSAAGRGPSFGIANFSASQNREDDPGGVGQGPAGGIGLTGVAGIPGDAGPAGPAPDSGPAPSTTSDTGQSGGAPFADGGFVPGRGSGDTVPARLEPGEFVVNKDAAKRHGGALSRINKEKGLRRPIESLDDLLTRARAYFDVGGASGPGMPTSRGPR